jgi:hypothetical protein
MLFNKPEKKDLLLTKKTETATNEQEMEWKELSDEEAGAINGGLTVISAKKNSTFSLDEFYKLSGFWGG